MNKLEKLLITGMLAGWIIAGIGTMTKDKPITYSGFGLLCSDIIGAILYDNLYKKNKKSD